MDLIEKQVPAKITYRGNYLHILSEEEKETEYEKQKIAHSRTSQRNLFLQPHEGEPLDIHPFVKQLLSEEHEERLLHATRGLTEKNKEAVKVYCNPTHSIPLWFYLNGEEESWFYMQIPWEMKAVYDWLSSSIMCEELDLPKSYKGHSLEVTYTRLATIAFQDKEESADGRYPIQAFDHPNANANGEAPCLGQNRWNWDTLARDQKALMIHDLLENYVGWDDMMSQYQAWGNAPIAQIKIEARVNPLPEDYKPTIITQEDPRFNKVSLPGYCTYILEDISWNQGPSKNPRPVNNCKQCIMDCPHSPLKKKRKAISKTKRYLLPFISKTFFRQKGEPIGSPFLEKNPNHSQDDNEMDRVWRQSPFHTKGWIWRQNSWINKKVGYHHHPVRMKQDVITFLNQYEYRDQ